MNIQRITEVGIAVHDLAAATDLFVTLFGATASAVYEVPAYQMRYRMCRVGKVDFELMEPTDEHGVIADFLARRGQGLHHIAFAVDDLESGMAVLRDKQVQFVDEAPVPMQLTGVDFAGRAFSGEVKLAFSHPRSVLGVLFEFIEYPPGYRTDDGHGSTANDAN